MRISNNLYKNRANFCGTTSIRALTDSHQEARDEGRLLSKIAQDAKTKDNILLLNCGDLFGGVYSRDLLKDMYLDFKKQNPNVEVVMTIGNNDLISSKDKYAPKDPLDNRNSIDFFKDTIEEFSENGINVVCANLRDKTTGKTPDWIKPYSIVERDGDRIFVTGFCIDRLPSKALNVDVLSQEEAFGDLIKYIEQEKPDSIIVLNHDYLDTSKKLLEQANKNGITIDLIIDGHDHDNPESLPELNLYSPKCFSKSMFEMDLDIKGKVKQILNAREIKSADLPISDTINSLLSDYEAKSGILDKVAPHILNLPKSYAHPGALGTFIADGMKDIAQTDVAFFASNVVRVPIYYQEGKDVLNYDTRKTITFDSTVQTAKFTSSELKDILTTAFENRLKLGEQNARFLQCSSNIKIVGEGNSKDKSYSIKQIYIDGKPLFNENGEPIDDTKKFTCAFDNFIPTDGRSKVLEKADKKDVITDGKKLRIDEVLKRQLISAEGKYETGITYPKYELQETII